MARTTAARTSLFLLLTCVAVLHSALCKISLAQLPPGYGRDYCGDTGTRAGGASQPGEACVNCEGCLKGEAPKDDPGRLPAPGEWVRGGSPGSPAEPVVVRNRVTLLTADTGPPDPGLAPACLVSCPNAPPAASRLSQ